MIPFKVYFNKLFENHGPNSANKPSIGYNVPEAKAIPCYFSYIGSKTILGLINSNVNCNSLLIINIIKI